jgi:hypothetical protein
MIVNDKKDETARQLAESHRQVEPTIERIIRFHGGNEDADEEPIKLLEVNTATVEAGIIPVILGATDEVPFATIIIEITREEWDKVRNGELDLPNGWEQGPTLWPEKQMAG